jgi:hypothetical protein
MSKHLLSVTYPQMLNILQVKRAELRNNCEAVPQAGMSITEDWIDYIITKLGKMAEQSWMSMVHGMELEEWYDIAQGYSAVVPLSPRSNLLELALGLKNHCTVRSFIGKGAFNVLILAGACREVC